MQTPTCERKGNSGEAQGVQGGVLIMLQINLGLAPVRLSLRSVSTLPRAQEGSEVFLVAQKLAAMCQGVCRCSLSLRFWPPVL